jgi:heme exporter protein B
VTRPPGFLAASLLVLRKDLRIEGRTKETLSSSLLFSIVVLVVFAFAFDTAVLAKAGTGAVVAGVVWVTLAFASLVGFTRSFRVERAREALVALALSPVDRGAIFAGKASANLIMLALVELALLPLAAVFFNADVVTPALPLALVLGVHTVGLAALGTLFGGVVSRLGRGEALMATLLLPAATPLFISAVHCTKTVLSGAPLSDDRAWLLLTAGLDVLYVLVSLLVFDAILED